LWPGPTSSGPPINGHPCGGKSRTSPPIYQRYDLDSMFDNVITGEVAACGI